jgi:glycerol-3-phosphate acyltransferase PlsY
VGSVPFSDYVARLAAGADLRRVGNGTVSASGVYQVAGTGPFLLVCLLDIGKGAVVARLTRRSGTATAAAAGLVIAGHAWSPLLRGAGGRGVLPAIGTLAVVQPAGAALLVGGIAAGRIHGDTAPSCFAAQLLLTPVLALTGGRQGALLGAAIAGPMMAKRLLGNQGFRPRTPARTYLTRALYDREHRRRDGRPTGVAVSHGRAVTGGLAARPARVSS